MSNKVVICGVNTATLPKLSDKRANELLSDEKAHAKMAKASNPYGDGQASRRIVEAILYYKRERNERPLDFLSSK